MHRSYLFSEEGQAEFIQFRSINCVQLYVRNYFVHLLRVQNKSPRHLGDKVNVADISDFKINERSSHNIKLGICKKEKMYNNKSIAFRCTQSMFKLRRAQFLLMWTSRLERTAHENSFWI
jgi:hypothetical protein